MTTEDNTGLKYTCMGLNVGFFRIALQLTGRAAMHLVVPNLIEQDCVVLDLMVVSCSGLNETEMG